MPLTLQGIPVDSKEEYYLGTALQITGWRYRYQVPLGPQGRRGSQRLDFLVYTPIRWTAIPLNGVYWHTGRRDDLLYQERAVKTKGWRYLPVWDYEVPSITAAIILIRRKLG